MSHSTNNSIRHHYYTSASAAGGAHHSGSTPVVSPYPTPQKVRTTTANMSSPSPSIGVPSSSSSYPVLTPLQQQTTSTHCETPSSLMVSPKRNLCGDSRGSNTGPRAAPGAADPHINLSVVLSSPCASSDVPIVAVVRVGLEATLASLRQVLVDLSRMSRRGETAPGSENAKAAIEAPLQQQYEPGIIVSHAPVSEVRKMQDVRLHTFDFTTPFRFVRCGGCRPVGHRAEEVLRVRDVLPRLPHVTASVPEKKKASREGLTDTSDLLSTLSRLFRPSAGCGVEHVMVDGRACLAWLLVGSGEGGIATDKATTERFLLTPPRGCIATVQHVSGIIHRRNGNLRDALGRTPLHEAVIAHDVQLVRHLLSLPYIDASAEDARGRTPLHLAVVSSVRHSRAECKREVASRAYSSRSDDDNLVRILLQARCSPLAQDIVGITPLHIALSLRADKVVGLITTYLKLSGTTLEHVARVRDAHGESPVELFRRLSPTLLDLAADHNVPALRALVSHYFFEPRWLKDVDHSGRSLVHVAADVAISDERLLGEDSEGSAKTTTLVFLVDELNVAATLRDHFGRTPLHYACMSRDTAAIRFLLARGADASAVDIAGRTPMHTALATGQAAVVDALLSSVPESTASVLYLQMDSVGWSPLHYAVACPGLAPFVSVFANYSSVPLRLKVKRVIAKPTRHTATLPDAVVGPTCLQVAIPTCFAASRQKQDHMIAMENVRTLLAHNAMRAHTTDEVAGIFCRVLAHPRRSDAVAFDLAALLFDAVSESQRVDALSPAIIAAIEADDAKAAEWCLERCPVLGESSICPGNVRATCYASMLLKMSVLNVLRDMKVDATSAVAAALLPVPVVEHIVRTSRPSVCTSSLRRTLSCVATRVTCVGFLIGSSGQWVPTSVMLKPLLGIERLLNATVLELAAGHCDLRLVRLVVGVAPIHKRAELENVLSAVLEPMKTERRALLRTVSPVTDVKKQSACVQLLEFLWRGGAGFRFQPIRGGASASSLSVSAAFLMRHIDRLLRVGLLGKVAPVIAEVLLSSPSHAKLDRQPSRDLLLYNSGSNAMSGAMNDALVPFNKNNKNSQRQDEDAGDDAATTVSALSAESYARLWGRLVSMDTKANKMGDTIEEVCTVLLVVAGAPSVDVVGAAALHRLLRTMLHCNHYETTVRMIAQIGIGNVNEALILMAEKDKNFVLSMSVRLQRAVSAKAHALDRALASLASAAPRSSFPSCQQHTLLHHLVRLGEADVLADLLRSSSSPELRAALLQSTRVLGCFDFQATTDASCRHYSGLLLCALLHGKDKVFLELLSLLDTSCTTSLVQADDDDCVHRDLLVLLMSALKFRKFDIVAKMLDSPSYRGISLSATYVAVIHEPVTRRRASECTRRPCDTCGYNTVRAFSGHRPVSVVDAALHCGNHRIFTMLHQRGMTLPSLSRAMLWLPEPAGNPDSLKIAQYVLERTRYTSDVVGLFVPSHPQTDGQLAVANNNMRRGDSLDSAEDAAVGSDDVPDVVDYPLNLAARKNYIDVLRGLVAQLVSSSSSSEAPPPHVFDILRANVVSCRPVHEKRLKSTKRTSTTLVRRRHFVHYLAEHGDVETLAVLLDLHRLGGFDGGDIFISDVDRDEKCVSVADTAVSARQYDVLLLLFAYGIRLSSSFTTPNYSVSAGAHASKSRFSRVEAAKLRVAIQIGLTHRSLPNGFDALHAAALVGDAASCAATQLLRLTSPCVVYNAYLGGHVSARTVALIRNADGAACPDVLDALQVEAVAADQYRVHPNKRDQQPYVHGVRDVLSCGTTVTIPMCRRRFYLSRESVLVEAIRLGQEQRALHLVRELDVSRWDTCISKVDVDADADAKPLTLCPLMALGLFHRTSKTTSDIASLRRIARALLQRGAVAEEIDAQRLSALVCVFAHHDLWDIATRIVQSRPGVTLVAVSPDVAPYLQSHASTHPLHYAARSPLSQREHIDIILARTTAEDAYFLKDKRGNTSLGLAAASGNIFAVEALLAGVTEKPQVHHANGAQMRTPLALACWGGKTEIATALVGSYHSLNLPLDVSHERSGASPLLIAARAGHRPVMDILLSAGCTPQQRDKQGESFVLVAARAGHDALALHLLQRWVHSNGLILGTSSQATILHCAAIGNCPDTAEHVLRNISTGPAYVFQPDCHGHTALQYSYVLGSTDVKRVLLDYLHDRALDIPMEHLCDDDRALLARSSALHSFGWFRDLMTLGGELAPRIRRLPTGYGATVSATLGAVDNLLLYFSRVGNPVGIRILADHCVTDDCGALHLAAYHGHLDVVQVLIQLDMSKPKAHLHRSHWTAVETNFMANRKKHASKNKSSSRLFLDRKPHSPSAMNGYNALMCAIIGGNERVAQYLLDSVADEERRVLLTDRTPEGYNVLHLIAMFGTAATLGNIVVGESVGATHSVWLRDALSVRGGHDDLTPGEVVAMFGHAGCVMRLFYTIRSVYSQPNGGSSGLFDALPTQDFLHGIADIMSPITRTILFDFFDMKFVLPSGQRKDLGMRRLLWPDIRAMGLAALRLNPANDKFIAARFEETYTLAHEREVFRSLLSACGVRCRVRVNMESLQGVPLRVLHAVTTTTLLGKYSRPEEVPGGITLQHIELEYTTGAPGLHIDTATGSVRERFSTDSAGNILTADVPRCFDELLRTKEQELQSGIENVLRRLLGQAPLARRVFRLKARVDWALFENNCAMYNQDYSRRLQCLGALFHDAQGVLSLEGPLLEMERLTHMLGDTNTSRGPLNLHLSFGSCTHSQKDSIFTSDAHDISISFDFHSVVSVSRPLHRGLSVATDADRVMEVWVLQPLRWLVFRLSMDELRKAKLRPKAPWTQYLSSLPIDVEAGEDVRAAIIHSRMTLLGVLKGVDDLCDGITSAVQHASTAHRSHPAQNEAVRSALQRQLKSICFVFEDRPSGLSGSTGKDARVLLTAAGQLRVILKCSTSDPQLVLPSSVDVQRGAVTMPLERDIHRLRDDAVPVAMSDYSARLMTYLPTTTLSADMPSFIASSALSTRDTELTLLSLSDLAHHKASNQAVLPLLHALSVGWDTPLGTLLRKSIKQVVIRSCHDWSPDNMLTIQHGVLVYSAPFGRVFDLPLVSPSFVASQVLLQLLSDDSFSAQHREALLGIVDGKRAFPYNCYISPYRTRESRYLPRYVVGNRCSFLIVARNVLSERCPGTSDAWTVRLVPISDMLGRPITKSSERDMKVRALGKGQYLACCTLPYVAGRYSIHATLHGTSVRNALTPIIVRAAGIDPKNCIVEVPYDTVVSGVTNTLSVHVRDCYGNPVLDNDGAPAGHCPVSTRAVFGAEIKSCKKKNGTFEIVWSATRHTPGKTKQSATETFTAEPTPRVRFDVCVQTNPSRSREFSEEVFPVGFSVLRAEEYVAMIERLRRQHLDDVKTKQMNGIKQSTETGNVDASSSSSPVCKITTVGAQLSPASPLELSKASRKLCKVLLMDKSNNNNNNNKTENKVKGANKKTRRIKRN
eukprot:PhM_4_TR14718/c0_g1_i1/m.62982